MTDQPWVAAARIKFITLASEAAAARHCYLNLIEHRSALQGEIKDKEDYAANLDANFPAVRFSSDAASERYTANRTALDSEICQLKNAVANTVLAIDDAQKKSNIILKVKNEVAQILLDLKIISQVEAAQ